MTYSKQHLSEAIEIINKLDTNKIEEIVQSIKEIRDNYGRIFFLGVGGSAGNCSHAVNDFRKILGIECYAPTDNVSELTARTNDDGWDSVFSEWLKVSHLSSKDGLFIFSVGGGNLEKNISPNLVKAVQFGLTVKAKILGIVGKDGGFTAKSTQQCLIIPTVNENNITPHSEAFQAVVWHLIVSHPELKIHQTKWESVK
jgi:D-sedoheptulose 7-phosphate isomerase